MVGRPKFPQNVQLTSVPNAGDEYEWHEGRLQPLCLLPDGEGAALGKGRVAEEELSQQGHQLADDGSVFFVYEGHLYMHDFAKDDAIRPGRRSGGRRVMPDFLYAASDGSKVLFSDPEQLTGSAGGGIYECRISTAGEPPLRT